MVATQVSPFGRTQQQMPQAQHAAHRSQPRLAAQGDDARVALQFLAKVVQRAHASLYLSHIGSIVFEVDHHRRIIDVMNGYAKASQLFAQHDVLVATLLESLIEGTAQHSSPVCHEISRSECLIGPLTSHGCRMPLLARLLIEKTQVTAVAGTDGDASVDDALAWEGKVVDDEIGIFYAQVAIHEEQPSITGFAGQQVSGGGTAGIALFLYIPTIWQTPDLTVLHGTVSVRRGIVGHHNLIAQVWTPLLGLLAHDEQPLNDVNANRIVNGNEDGNLVFAHFKKQNYTKNGKTEQEKKKKFASFAKKQ